MSSEVAIDIIANDEASGVIQTVQGNLQSLGTTAGTTTGGVAAVGTAAAGTNASLLSSVGSISQVTTGFFGLATMGYQVERAQNMVDRANLAVERSTAAVAKAQEVYNAAVKKYGTDSPQAVDSAGKLAIAIDAAAVASDRANLAQQHLTMSTAQLAVFGIPALITTLSALPKAYEAIALAAGKASSAMGLASSESAALSGGGTAATGVETTAVGGGTAAAGATGAGLATVAAGAAAVALAGVGAYDNITQLNAAIKSGSTDMKDYAAAVAGSLNPVQLMSQGIQDLMKQFGLVPAATASVGTQTVNVFQQLYDKIVGQSIWPDMWTKVVNTTQTSGDKVVSTVTAMSDQLTAAFGSANLDQLTAFDEEMGAIRESGTNLTINLSNAKTAATQLTDAFNSGQINTVEYSRLLESLGVSLAPTKDAISSIGVVVQNLTDNMATTSVATQDLTVVQQKLVETFSKPEALVTWGEYIGDLNESDAHYTLSATDANAAARSLIDSFKSGQMDAATFQSVLQDVIAVTDQNTASNDVFTTSMTTLGKTVASSSVTVQSSWSTAMTGMVSSTQTALSTVYSEMTSRLNAIVAAVQAAKNQISSHSIWPDMLDEMLAQTKTGMAAIQGEFAQGFEGPTGIIPTLQTGGQAAAGAVGGQGAAPAAPSSSQAITLPISVYLDGQQIQTFLEKRIVSTLYRDANRGKRGTV